MGLHDRMRPTRASSGGTAGEALEPIQIPALNLADAFDGFDPFHGTVSPYPWAPLQRRRPAIGASPDRTSPDDPEGLNALATRARGLAGDLPAPAAVMAAALDAVLAQPDELGDTELPAVGDGTLARRLLERAGVLEVNGETPPSLVQWLALLALALLGKTDQLIREIDRDAERISRFDPTEFEFFQNEFNLDRLHWFQSLVAECREAVLESMHALTADPQRRSREAGRRGAEIANRRKRELKRIAEQIYLEDFLDSSESNRQIAFKLWERIKEHNHTADGGRILPGLEPERTTLPYWVAEFRDRHKGQPES